MYSDPILKILFRRSRGCPHPLSVDLGGLVIFSLREERFTFGVVARGLVLFTFEAVDLAVVLLSTVVAVLLGALVGAGG